MTTIELPHRLITPLQQLATAQGSSVEEVIAEALDDYLREQRHKQLLQEMERYRTRHGQLKDQYAGQFIGMYNGAILDHDADGGLLYSRLRQEHGELPILIVQVTPMPDQEFLRLQRYVLS